MKPLQLYSRPNCHLCDRLLDELQPVLAAGTQIEIIDISDDPDLLRRYGLRIPILSAGTEEISGYPLDIGRVEKFLAKQNP